MKIKSKGKIASKPSQIEPAGSVHLPPNFWADTLVAVSEPKSQKPNMKTKKPVTKGPGAKRAKGQADGTELVRSTISYTQGVEEMAKVMMKLRGFGNNFSVFVSTIIREKYEDTLRLYHVQDAQVDTATRQIIAAEIKKAHDRSGDPKAALLEAILQSGGSTWRVIQGFQQPARLGDGSSSEFSEDTQRPSRPEKVF